MKVRVGPVSFDPTRAVIAVGCIYELCALPERSPLPTISDLVNLLRNHNKLWIMALAWDVLWDDHFGLKVR